MLVYDGECPLCSAYCRMLAIKQLESRFEIINARQYHPVLEGIKERGLDLEEGFVLKIENDYFHGADAINRLALITTRAGLFNRLNYLIFKSAHLSKILYPMLRTGRNILLYLWGIRKMDRVNLPSGLNSNPD